VTITQVPAGITSAACNISCLQDTVSGFRAIVDGEHDDLPEQAFYMQGNIDGVVQKAKDL